MSLDYFLLPSAAVDTNPKNASSWLKEHEGFAGNASEIKKKELADFIAINLPDFVRFRLRYSEIAAAEGISEDEARRKYRHIEFNSDDIQLTLMDEHVALSVSCSVDDHALERVLETVSREGDFLLYDPQADEVFDLR